MITLPSVAALSAAFRAKMRRALKPEQLRAIDEYNRSRPHDDTCATHDHCDANMVMHAAGLSLGVDFSETADWSDAMVALWADAWNLAIEEGFST